MVEKLELEVGGLYSPSCREGVFPEIQIPVYEFSETRIQGFEITIASIRGSGRFGSEHTLWVITTSRGSASLFSDRPFRYRCHSTLPMRG